MAIENLTRIDVRELIPVIERDGGDPGPAEILAQIRELFESKVREWDLLAAELQRQNEDLTRRVGEMSQELEQKRRLAAIGEMASQVAHEIRNPLGAIALYVDLLGKAGDVDPRRRALVEKIDAGVDRLNAVVDAMLTFAREVTVNRRRVRLADLLSEAVADGLQGAPALKVETRIEPSGVEIGCDPGLLGRCFANLAANAAQACGPGGRLEILARVEAGTAVVRFRDDGPGIPAELLPRLFMPFQTGRERGIGLGLAIVKRLVEAHGGRVEAANDPLGGAVFTVVLPADGEER